MIYLVTTQSELFTNNIYTVIGIDKCLSLLHSMKIIQVDTETNGRDAHINQLLCIQFGNDELDCRIVVDTSTIDITKFKEVLEKKYLVLQHAKFDLQFLFNYNIHPTKIYDIMIVEQLLYLGWGYNMTYNLRDIAYRRLNIDIDKTMRSQIIWRGLDTEVIQYAAGDVTYLEKIMWSQYEDLKQKGLVEAAKLECDFVSPLSYFEWCGIHLDENKWKSKMDNDQRCLEEAKKALDSYVVTNSSNTNFIEVDLQGDLFEGFNTEPKCTINWDSPKQVTAYFNYLGFDTKVQDKKTGEDKDSVLEKVLKGQKGIADDFLKLYFKYKEHAKVCSTYGQGHLNSINPNTGRIHTIFKQLGAASGRLSCGSRQENSDLAKLKGIPAKYCTYPNLQQLPSDEVTRSCFTAQKGNLFCSCDYSAIESRLGGDIYNEPAIINEFLYGSGDMHSLVAKACFPIELKDIEVKDIKKLRPDLRQRAKGPEFAMQFGGSPRAIQQALGCSLEEAEIIAAAYWKGFPGVAKFKAYGSKEVRSKGYVLMCKKTGHKMFWWDFDKWCERQKSFTQEFWEKYRTIHKPNKDSVYLEVKEHFQAVSKWDRMALNAPTQGSGAVIIKQACIDLFKWVIDNGYFGKVLFCVLVHDEINVEYPKELESFPTILSSIMEKAAAIYCESMPIPAVPEVGDHWIH